jgi:microcystin-dependent protein
MPLKLANNATSLLANNIDTVATTIALTSGDELKFPALVAGDWFPVTLTDASGNREIMRVTARSGVNMTVTRAQESTIARSFSAGARIDLRLTAGALIEQTSNASALTTGTLADARLPARLGATGALAADCNAITAEGFYYTNPSSTNVPVAGTYGFLLAQLFDSNNQYQIWEQYNADTRYIRKKIGGTWGSWDLQFTGQQVPAGAVMDYAGPTAPAGWLLCYGQAISRTTYALLYAAIGTSYGAGDGSTTFNVPDFRGRVGAGQDDMGGTSANRLTGLAGGVNGDTLGAAGGEQAHILGQSEIPAHQHAQQGTFSTSTAGAHAHNISLTAGDGGVANTVGTGGITGSSGGTGGTQSAGNHAHTITLSGSTGVVGSGGAHNNVQPTIVMNKIIKTGLVV